MTGSGDSAPLKEISNPLELKSGTWLRDAKDVMVCFDLPKGRSQLSV